MKPLYITAVVTYSGKTALALGIGLKMQAMGRKVGYLKPISTQPIMSGGKLVDEDAEFVGRTLGLAQSPAELSPIVMDDSLLKDVFAGKQSRDYVAEIRVAYEKAGQGRDVLLLEGGASMREGYMLGLNAIKLAELFDMQTLGVVRYRSPLMSADDALAMKGRLGAHLLGVVINSVPADAMEEVTNSVAPYLEREGVRVYGLLPTEQKLMSISVNELVGVLGAKNLTKGVSGDGLIENLSVGAMSVEAAMPHFRRTLRKAVITGGDRADIQAAALETSTTALILTGNLTPSSTILKHAESRGVSVLLVPYNTIQTVEKVESVFGKTRLAHPEKLQRFRESLDAHMNWTRFLDDFGA